MTRASGRLVVTVVLAAACGGGAPPLTAPTEPAPPVAPGSEDPWTEAAAAGVADAGLAALLRDHWQWRMEQSPTFATRLGDHRYDDRLHDPSDAAERARGGARRAFLARAEGIAPATLSEADATTLALFAELLRAEVDEEVCQTHLWNLSAMSNPLTSVSYLPRLVTVETPAQGAALVSRYRAASAHVDAHVDNLRLGLSRGLVANAETTRRVIAMVREQLDEPDARWPLMAPSEEPHPGWSDAEREVYRRDLAAAVSAGVRPALARFAAFLETEVLPAARPDDRVGLGALPLGEACYPARVRYHTGLDLGVEAIHRRGHEEMARINDEMRRLGAALFETEDLPAILARLRGDRALYFDTEEAVEEKARAALAAARARMPDFFGVLPRADCVVVRVPDYEAPFTTIAYYRPPHADGSKPGEYFVNTTEPTTRPRYEAEVLAYHEAIPGHHLQIAIAQELEAMPAFRLHLGLTAYVEGWALYTERLADEMGLYGGDLDRMGMLSYDAWRAARLVVDTGLHAMGWSREQAVQYMLEHTALAENNIRNEVDRYVSWPGQALAYKLGQLEIQRLRASAEEALGDRFDVRGFHDAVLSGGAVSLPVLEGQVARWVRRRAAQPGGR